MNELRRQLGRADWRTSSRSGSGDQCVEVAGLAEGHHAVRDSKDPSGGTLVLTVGGWRALLGAARRS